MRKDTKKTPKGGRTKKAAVKDLDAKDAKAVKGGSRTQEKYLQIKLNDALISSFS